MKNFFFYFLFICIRSSFYPFRTSENFREIGTLVSFSILSIFFFYVRFIYSGGRKPSGILELLIYFDLVDFLFLCALYSFRTSGTLRELRILFDLVDFLCRPDLHRLRSCRICFSLCVLSVPDVRNSQGNSNSCLLFDLVDVRFIRSGRW